MKIKTNKYGVFCRQGKGVWSGRPYNSEIFTGLQVQRHGTNILAATRKASKRRVKFMRMVWVS